MLYKLAHLIPIYADRKKKTQWHWTFAQPFNTKQGNQPSHTLTKSQISWRARAQPINALFGWWHCVCITADAFGKSNEKSGSQRAQGTHTRVNFCIIAQTHKETPKRARTQFLRNSICGIMVRSACGWFAYLFATATTSRIHMYLVVHRWRQTLLVWPFL